MTGPRTRRGMAPLPHPLAGDLLRVAVLAAYDRAGLGRPLTVREAAGQLRASGCDARPCGCDARALIALTELVYAQDQRARAERRAQLSAGRDAA